ncbi:MAG: DUF2079 domain-containing protein, partial [Chloroflexi bacterium]|nr:DUF2079 domain-containing protein [Chloroflexota bacterium]
RQIPQHQIGLQYGLLLIVPAVVASSLGARRALAWWSIRHRRRTRTSRSARLAPSVAIAACVGLVVCLAVWTAFAGGSVPPFSSAGSRFWNRPAAIETVRAIAAGVPADAPLAVDWGMASALASRPHIEVLRNLTDDAWVLIDGDPYVSGSFSWADRTSLVLSLPGSGRPLLHDDGRFTLWGPLGD